MEDDFYIVLPSNAQERNTPAQFLTNFSSPFKVNNPHEWEVGLKEINFKNTIRTINLDSAIVHERVPYAKVNETNPLDFTGSILKSYDFNERPAWTIIRETVRDTFLEKNFHTLTVIDLIYENDYFKMYLSSDHYVCIANKTKFELSIKLPMALALCLGLTSNISEGIEITENSEFLIKSILKDEEYVGLRHPLLVPATTRELYLYPEGLTSTYTIYFKKYYQLEEKASLAIKSGTYVDPKELVKELNRDKTFAKYFKFSYDHQLNRIDITTIPNDNATELHLLNGLHDVLGFTETIISNNSNIQKGQLEVNLLRGITSLFIYCDAVQPIHVGTIMAPLLRTVSFNVKQYGEMIHVNYTNPIYLNLNKSFFDMISIKICDVVGELIPFAEGLTTMVLHFKRKL